MKKINIVFIITLINLLSACGTSNEPETVEALARYELAYVEINEIVTETPDVFVGSTLTFIGEEAGGALMMMLGETTLTAYINPSRAHPSFEAGQWHHHLYAGVTAPGSPRINFRELLPHLNLDENIDATDNTQSSYQHGNLHYLVETGVFRLRFVMNGDSYDLFFIEVE